MTVDPVVLLFAACACLGLAGFAIGRGWQTTSTGSRREHRAWIAVAIVAMIAMVALAVPGFLGLWTTR